MKTSKLEFLGYYCGAELRLYRKVTPKSVRVYLIPSSRSLAEYRLFEISKDFGCYIISNWKKI